MSLSLDCAIIPARSGSKRILRKNLREFLGIPMIVRSVSLAKSLCADVIVSSDDSEILRIAKDMGVCAHRREDSLCDDFSSTLDVMEYEVNRLGLDPSAAVLCLYPTAMFATKELICQALRALNHNKDAAYVAPVIRNDKILRSFKLDNGRIDFLFNEFASTRGQDLPSCFCDSGQFYLGFARSFTSRVPILSKDTIAIELDYAIDIDTEADLAMAEALCAFYQNREH